MSSISILGDTSGSVLIQAPAVAGSTTLTLPATTGTVMATGNMPTFRAYKTSNQNIPTANTLTKITWQATSWDTASAFSTANSRFQPTVAGYYQINHMVSSSGLSNESFSVLYKNGSGYFTFWDISCAWYQQSGSTLVYMNGSTDYLETYIYFGASSITVYSGSSWTSEFSGALVRTA